ncbi:MAG: DUF917 domain-containing protein [Candidatus Thorarchaeota archaeon]
MKKILFEDLEDLSLGVTVLGSGGGGNPSYDLLIAKQHMKDHGEAHLLDVTDLNDNDFVAPLAFIGAPLVGMEKLPSGREFCVLLETLEKVTGKKVTHLMPAEIGGGNALTPFMVASQLRIPILDADTIGRAFPELQMSSCNLHGISPSPAFLSDSLGNVVIVNGNDGYTIERFCRNITVEMGSSAALSLYMMSGKEAKKAVIAGSVSKAISIGKTMRIAKKKGTSPLSVLLDYTGGLLLASGMIVDIEQSVQEGFLKGSFSLHTDKGDLEVFYQNEYLAVFHEKRALALTPDIIIPLEEESGKPITSESLIYGLRVVLIKLPAPDLWKTKQGMKFVGPQYFGYNMKGR